MIPFSQSDYLCKQSQTIMTKAIQGFSKLSKAEKQTWLAENHLKNPQAALHLMQSYMHGDDRVQRQHDEFTENTIANFYMPLGVAPNFLIDGVVHSIPMATEESSVVAAAAKAASFWLHRGGFKTQVISMTKVGHVHFSYSGHSSDLTTAFNEAKPALLASTDHITANMRQRGGGILSIALIDKSDALKGYHQLAVQFNTADSMGANFINSCLEVMAQAWKMAVADHVATKQSTMEVIMSILSNHNPDCRVISEVTCPVTDLKDGEIQGEDFAQKFKQAVDIAEIEPFRAATHNKGIMNGIDAVVMATGNDFRAVEAGCHSQAAMGGQYSSLSHCSIIDGQFRFWIDIPLALGTVGGLTKLHPLVTLSHEVLNNPNAKQLMGIVATSGLAQNFAALRALTTTGIQQGHMKMHLKNILNQLGANEGEKQSLTRKFSKSTPHHADVKIALQSLRANQP